MVVAGAVNQIFLVYGFSKAQASTLAPFTYFEIIASIIIGYLMFGTLPVLMAWTGIALIIISGIMVAYSVNSNIVPRRNPKI